MDANNKHFRLKLQCKWQKIVDFLNGKRADRLAIVLYLLIGLFAMINFIAFLRLIRNPIMVKSENSIYQGIFILLSLGAFFLSSLGEKLKKPSKRVPQFIFIIAAISIFSLMYFANTFNLIFRKALFHIENINVIPIELITGNIRIITFLVPLSIIIPISFLTLSVLGNSDNKKKIKELEIDMLLPTVHKSNDTTIDLKICDDLDTGLPCIVPEKVAYEHFWVQGGSGSGKTATFLQPLEEQLFKKKAYLNYKLKESVYYCLQNDIAKINKPVTNKWFNENFDIDLVEPIEGMGKDFIKAIENEILGIRDSNKVIFNKAIVDKEEIELESLKSKDYYYEIEMDIKRKNMDVESFTLKIDDSKLDFNLRLGNFGLISSTLCERKLYVDEDTAGFKLSENMGQIIKLEIIPTEDYEIKTIIALKGTGRIIPKDLGMTVVAPDGDLIKNTVKIANEYRIKVHKIDPFMEEIRKGNVAKFNPLKGDSPEKIGDIVASILVTMEVGQSAKVNPYFTNASVRAVRNLVILLKVTFPEIEGRDPTLEDVLFCLNDFNRVKNYIKYLEAEPVLSKRWGNVIDYFKASFLDPPKDNKDRDIKGVAIGSQKRKTQEAVGGIINQLDNLLGREEIRYILCDPDESIDLKKVLEKGEIIAISTRQGDLGQRLGRAFALFFILSLQNEVLSRYAEGENPEIPHYLIIDEFPMYCNENTETFFTFARKYKCSVTIAIQNMGQLKRISDEFGETIFTNTTTKLLLPKSNLEDRKYWSAYFGKSNKLELMTGVSKGAMSSDNPIYGEQLRGGMKKVENVAEDEINDLNFQNLFYSYTNYKGRQVIGKGETDFVKIKKEPFMDKLYDFEKYCISEKEYEKKLKIKKAIKEYNKKERENKSISQVICSPEKKDSERNTIYEKVEENVTKESLIIEKENKNDNEQILEEKRNDVHKPTTISIFEEVSQETLSSGIDNTTKENKIYSSELKDKDNKKETKIDDDIVKSFSMDDDIKAFFISEEK